MLHDILISILIGWFITSFSFVKRIKKDVLNLIFIVIKSQEIRNIINIINKSFKFNTLIFAIFYTMDIYTILLTFISVYIIDKK